MIEIIALVVAICAFFVSIAAPIFEFIWNNKLNRHNLKAEYFRNIYGEILYQEVPMALNYIHYNGDEVSGTEKLCDVLRNIRNRSVYFKVVDEAFFDKLKSALQDLEDYLVQSPEKMSSSEFATFYAVINSKIEIIYKYMSDTYMGKKGKKNKTKFG